MTIAEAVIPLTPGTEDPARETWIRKTPGVCGGEACIRNTRVTVWGLVAWRKQGLSDPEIRGRVPEATEADVRAALAYYERNRGEIDRVITENDQA